MMNPINENIVKQFIMQLKKQWNNLVVEYRYDTDEDVWDIWHYNYELQYNDINFQKSIGKLIRTQFFDQGIFNISFGYKHKTENYVFNTAGLISVELSVAIGDSVPLKWLSDLPTKPNSSLDGNPIKNISGYAAYSGLICSYDYEPGIRGSIGTTIIKEGIEVLAA